MRNAEALQLGHRIAGPHRVDQGAFVDLDDQGLSGASCASAVAIQIVPNKF